MSSPQFEIFVTRKCQVIVGKCLGAPCRILTPVKIADCAECTTKKENADAHLPPERRFNLSNGMRATAVAQGLLVRLLLAGDEADGPASLK